MKYFYLFILVIITDSSFAQSLKLNQVIPPSPITREFDKYITYPVSLTNGVPEISIPLYNIQLKGLSIPITLSYHASGIKYKQTSGEVGVGWVLNPRYRVSKKIYGREDEVSSMPSQYSDPFNSFGTEKDRDNYLTNFYDAGNATWFPTGTQLLDGEYDIYNYGLENASGTFIYTDRINKVFEFLDGKGLKITHAPTNSNNYFELVDRMGNQYSLGKNSAIETLGSQSFSWLATDITTVYNESVNISYVNRINNDDNNIGNATIKNGIGCQKNFDDGCNAIWNTTASSDFPLATAYNTPLINTITAQNEKIYFTHEPNSTLLNKIEVYDVSNKLVKRIQFIYTQNGFYTLLSKVQIFSTDLTNPQEYSFNYFPGDGSLINTTFDDWGYHYHFTPINGNKDYILPPSLQFDIPLKDELGNDNRYPYQYLNAESFNFSDKTITTVPDCFSLQRITYPTGGFTEFEYESNKIPYFNGSLLNGMGLRIKKITSYASASTASIIKEYKYGINENGRGLSPIVNIEPGDFVTEGIYSIHAIAQGAPGGSYAPSFRITQTQLNYSNSATNEVISEGYSKFFYPEVNEYQKDQNGAVLGKTQYLFSVPDSWYNAYDKFQTNGSYPFYWTSNGILQTKSRTYFPRIIKNYAPWMQPQKIAQNSYNYSNNNFTIVKSEQVAYNEIIRNSFTGLKVRPFLLWADNPYTLDPYGNSAYDDIYLQSLFDFSFYTIKSGVRLPSQRTITDYSLGNNLTTTISYFYNNDDQLAKEEVENSKGEVNITEYKYPFDYPNLTATDAVTLGIKNLQSRNIIDPVIEKSIWKKYANGSKKLINTLFAEYNTDLPTIKSLSVIENSSPLVDFSKSSVQNGSLSKDYRYVPRIKFEKYDLQGNILEQQKVNDIKEVYLWGYNSQYPVAKLVGTTYDIAKNYVTQSVLNNPVDDATLRSHLSNLRNIPGAIVTTYTYKPLVGMSSQTDANGKTIFYYYDAYGRLQLIRDQDGKVLKKICYNFAGQVTDCSINTTASWTATGNVQCATSGGVNTGYQQREEIDNNPYSTTYNQTRWVDNGYNTTACPLTSFCDYNSCNIQGEGYTCINGQCENGYKVYTSSYFEPAIGMYECWYHYEYSDGSWSQDYYENTFYPCY